MLFGILRAIRLNHAPVFLGRDRVSTRPKNPSMATNTTDRQLMWAVFGIVAALVVVLPTFGMIGAGPVMGGMWSGHMWGAGGASGWRLLIGVGMQLLFLVVIVGAVYLGYRALTEQDRSLDPALDELRAAYARGDLSDEEYERRQERLETES